MFKVYVRALDLVGEPIDQAATRELEAALDYIETLLATREWLVGDRCTAADIQTSFIPELAQAVGAFTGHATITTWQKRLYARPAFHRAIERGGKYDFARPE